MLKSKNNAHIPYDPKLKERAAALRRRMTPAENKLWFEYLKNHKLKFNRQKPLAYFIADFYCSKLKLVIEVDGDFHFSNFGIGYDKYRTEYLDALEVKVIRFTNHDVINNTAEVIDFIEHIIKETQSSLNL